ncbi:MAG: lipoyl synthase [Nitrospirae bacterium]|nr:lipoyl synthase [Nitrospirota bacterium]
MQQHKYQRRPEWLKTRLPVGDNYNDIKRLLRSSELHTVCEEANCPNIGECFSQRTATFLILGSVCTRGCRFCNVDSGMPLPLDSEEPERVARAAKEMGLKHIVVTSVTRDDVPDGGAAMYAMTTSAIRRHSPDSTIEVLIPDFKGSDDALYTVVRERPDVINHNIETVPRLYTTVRPGAVYERSLRLLKTVSGSGYKITVKAGLMAGLGEEFQEIVEAMRNIRDTGCEILTIGQYLSPTRNHLPVLRYYHPDEFKELKAIGLELGFKYVESGPLVRSSYHAVKQMQMKVSPEGQNGS